jgi:ATP synthase in type III secretion protein N
LGEAARSLLDGHIALSAQLAAAGRFPAIDVLASASRTMEAVADENHRRAASKVRRAVALLDRIADARALGVEPATRDVRSAIAAESRLEAFLRQRTAPAEYAITLAELARLAALVEDGGGDR